MQYPRCVQTSALTTVLLASLVFGCHGRDNGELAPVGATAPRVAPAPVPTPMPSLDAAAFDAPVPVDAARSPDAAVRAAKHLGTHGQICALGSRHPEDASVTPVECGPGLQCCYPCGIQGCDSVCHTRAECDLDRRRP
jgi:hypothetical protein